MRPSLLTRASNPVQADAATHRAPLAAGWSLWRLGAVRGAGMPFAWLDPFGATAAGQPLAEADEATAREGSAAAVRHLVARPAFLEAVTWQNPELVTNWLGGYAAAVREHAVGLSRRDQREALVAFLAQRYCAKNETIGFFGPVAWARFDPDASGLVTRGEGGLRHRTLYTEAWAADALAQALAAGNPPLRRHPACTINGDLLYRPLRTPRSLTEAERRVWEALAHSRRRTDLTDEAALDVLLADGAVLAGAPVPVDEAPERHLPVVVPAWHKAREAVAKAAGDPVALLPALAELADRFEELTAQPGHRTKSRQRFGRSLVYEDCRRDLDVTVGGDLLDDLREPLRVMLDAARWFVSELGAEVERDLIERHRERSGEVSLCDLLFAAGDVFTGQPGTAADRVSADFTERWRELLALAEPDGDDLRLSTRDMAGLARALFPAGPVAWRAARQHSPDLLLRRRPGDRPQWVLGELHVALNTLENRPFLTQADDPDELRAANAADFASGRVVPVYPKDGREVTSRTYPPPALDPPGLYTYWSYTADDGHPGSARPWPGAGLLVRVEHGRLVVSPVGGGFTASVLEFVGEFLTALAVDRFRPREPGPYLPRLLLDDVVIARAAWRREVAQAPLPAADGGDYRHRALREWLLALGVPRFTFARVPGERKPFLLDRDAPLSLRNLARSLRRVSSHETVTLTEMLPAPDELWLSTPDGMATSELRVVAYDEDQGDGMTP